MSTLFNAKHNKPARRYSAHDYLIIILSEGGYVHILNPDFGFRLAEPPEPGKRHRWTALNIMKMEIMIEEKLKGLDLNGENHPIPIKWRQCTDATPYPDNDLLSINDAATILGIPEHQVRRLCISGELKHELSSGKHRRFKRSDLEKFESTRSKQ